jgi:predicted RNase H-like HicB family nuclease
MRSKQVTVIIEASSTGYGAFTDALPGITGYAKTVEEAKNDFETAFNEVVEEYKSKREDLPIEFNNGNLSFSYKYDIQSIFEHVGILDISGFARRIKMNPSLLRQYKGGHALASDAQKKKIETGLHELGKELLKLRL